MIEQATQVLIVDDSPTVLNFAKLVLQAEGCTVHTAEDGERGLVLAEKHQPGIIFIDYVLPNMTGRDFCEEVSRNPDLQGIPLILMTSKGDDVAARLTTDYPGMRYLAKPFEPEDLIDVFQQCLPY